MYTAKGTRKCKEELSVKKRTHSSKKTNRQAISFAGIFTSGIAIVALALMVVMSFGSSTTTASAADSVTICHAGATMTVSAGQLSAYFKGGAPVTAGDYMGPCQAPAKTTTSSAPAVTTPAVTTPVTATPPAPSDRGNRNDQPTKLETILSGANNSGNGGTVTTNAAPAVTTPTASPSPSPSPSSDTTNQNRNNSSNDRDPSRLADIIANLSSNQSKSTPPPATATPTATPVVQVPAVVVQTAPVAPTWTQQVQNVQTMNVGGDNNRNDNQDWVSKLVAGRNQACADNNAPATVQFNGNGCNGNVGGSNPCDNNTVSVQGNNDWCHNGNNGGSNPCDNFQAASFNNCHDNDCQNNWQWWCGNVGGFNPCDLVPDGHGGFISPCHGCDTNDNVILSCGFNCGNWDSRFGTLSDWQHRCNIDDNHFCDNWNQSTDFGTWMHNCHSNGCDSWNQSMGSWDTWNNWCHHDPCDTNWNWNWDGRGQQHTNWWNANHDRDCHNDQNNVSAVVVVCGDGSQHVVDFDPRDKHVVRWDGNFDGNNNGFGSSNNGFWWDGHNMRDHNHGDVIVVICPQVQPTVIVQQIVNVIQAPALPVVLQSILPQTVSPVVQQAQQQVAPVMPVAVLAASNIRPPVTGDAGVERIIPLGPTTTVAPAAIPARNDPSNVLGLALVAGAFALVLGLFRLRTAAQH